MLKKLLIIGGGLAAILLAFAAYVIGAPVVVLHYSPNATEPVGYFFNNDHYVKKDYIYPGTVVKFHTDYHPHPDYFIDVSLPFASRDHVEITPPFSRVDVYIGADTKITRTVVKTDFLARFTSD